MKKSLLSIVAAALLLTACNPATEKKDHTGMQHAKPPAKNVMMTAMDESMRKMHQAKQTGNADYDFAAMMVPHHQGAIVMAEAVVKKGKSPALISFAKRVIVAQQKEIKMFNDFLKTASQQPTKDTEQFKKAIAASMLPMMEGMGNIKLSNTIDHDFVLLMVPHHQSAVDMAKAYLPYSNNPNISRIAEQILKIQEEEIKWLKMQ